MTPTILLCNFRRKFWINDVNLLLLGSDITRRKSIPMYFYKHQWLMHDNKGSNINNRPKYDLAEVNLTLPKRWVKVNKWQILDSFMFRRPPTEMTTQVNSAGGIDNPGFCSWKYSEIVKQDLDSVMHAMGHPATGGNLMDMKDAHRRTWKTWFAPLPKMFNTGHHYPSKRVTINLDVETHYHTFWRHEVTCQKIWRWRVLAWGLRTLWWVQIARVRHRVLTLKMYNRERRQGRWHVEEREREQTNVLDPVEAGGSKR